jgi:ankyrin repeat protein
MKHLLLTTIAAVVLATTAFADPIHDAAKAGDSAGVQAELDKGVDVDKEDLSGLTPLHFAARLVHKEIAELLIDKGANVNAVWGGRVTPLHEAAWWGRKEIAELLIAAGAEVNAKVNDGRTPLAMAFEQDNPETADIIRKHGGMTSAELVSGMTLLHIATKEGKMETIELLIANGADVNAMDRDVKTPLDWAEGTNNKEIADLLRKHGGKTGEELNVLIAAAKKGDIEAVKQHLAAGADVNGKTWDWTTPLHNAAVYGHKEVAELLIANGADVNAIIVSGRNQGKTPLDLAIWRKKTETADLLRKHGGRTAEELALMPRLEYGKDRWPFTVSFTTAEGSTYVFQASGDLKNWSKVEEVNGTGGEVKVTDWREAIFQKQYYRVKLVE